jgi:phosphoribosylglycinamide formyltransferase-1
MSIAVLLSGSGTNLEALYEEQKRLERSAEKLYGRIDAVFTNAPSCRGLERARTLGIRTLSLGSKSYFDVLQKSWDDEQARNHYDAAVISLIEEVCKPDLIVLAGFKRRLSRLFITRYGNRIVNLYPGDTTKPYLVRGVEAPIQALRAGENTIKCTVYIQRGEERFGPAIAQSQGVSLEGFREEDVERIQEKIRREAEWKLFPFAVHHLIANGRVGIDEENHIYIDGVRMPEGGYQL